MTSLTSKQFQPALELKNQNIILNTNNKMAKRGPKPGALRKFGPRRAPKPRVYDNPCPVGCQGYYSGPHKMHRAEKSRNKKIRSAAATRIQRMFRRRQYVAAAADRTALNSLD